MFYNETHYGTGNNQPGKELCTLLPVNLGYTARRAIFEIDLGTGPVPGEILTITARLETTNPYTYNISIVDGLFLSTTSSKPDGIGVDNNTGYEVVEDLGENATPSIHHAVADVARQWQCQPTDPDLSAHRYLKYVLVAGSTGALPGHNIQVMQDYGQMDCIRKTPIDLQATIDAAVAAALAELPAAGLIAHTHSIDLAGVVTYQGTTGPAVPTP